MSKKFSGVRRRVEGARARHAVSIVTQRGYSIKHHSRLGDDTGYQIRTHEGPVINLYDTGSITVSGNNRHLFEDVDALKLPETSPGLLIVATHNDEALSDLSALLAGWHITHEVTLFGDASWMADVAQSKKRGLHVLVLISAAAPLTATALGHRAEPRVYFGLGLLVARLGRAYVSVICHEAMDMPPPGEMFGTDLMRYSHQVTELDERLRIRLQRAGVGVDEQQLAAPS